MIIYKEEILLSTRKQCIICVTKKIVKCKVIKIPSIKSRELITKNNHQSNNPRLSNEMRSFRMCAEKMGSRKILSKALSVEHPFSMASNILRSGVETRGRRHRTSYRSENEGSDKWIRYRLLILFFNAHQ